MRITELRKTYHVSGRSLPVLKGLTLQPAPQGITVILGRSGCGKTTLLRLAAGLEKADSGSIRWDDVEEEGSPENAKEAASLKNQEQEHEETPHWEKQYREKQAKIGVIFQEPRLMPWLSVEKNILFGVWDRSDRERKLTRLLELTGLTGFEKARPAQLSGGMQQRVALARALACEPDYLLMDEPFAALDYFTRAQMQRELVRIYEREKKGILFVTHSIDEALMVGTRIVILEDGICGKEYGLEDKPFPRDLASAELMELKQELIMRIEGFTKKQSIRAGKPENQI